MRQKTDLVLRKLAKVLYFWRKIKLFKNIIVDVVLSGLKYIFDTHIYKSFKNLYLVY